MDTTVYLLNSRRREVVGRGPVVLWPVPNISRRGLPSCAAQAQGWGAFREWCSIGSPAVQTKNVCLGLCLRVHSMGGAVSAPLLKQCLA